MSKRCARFERIGNIQPGDRGLSQAFQDVANLHGDKNNLTKQTALTEKSEVVNGRRDQPNRHDILTGSQQDGTALAAHAYAPRKE
jgi:hypothetical protein